MKPISRNVILAIVFLAISLVTASQSQQDSAISDKEMKLVDFADLEYPKLARTALVQGIVIVRAKLDDKGYVVDSTALSGSDVLIPDSLANARKWRFQPNAKKAVIIVYNFRVTNAVSKSGCSHFMLDPPNFATITSCAPQIQ
jgi:outer membrane biosynthesis protein TonB